MPILTLEKIGPTVMRERAERARELFRSSIWPIYGSRKGNSTNVARGDLALVGSCVFISIRNRYYIITAAHVTDNLSHTPLWIPRGEDFWPIHGMLHETVSPEGQRKLDVFDCCWVEISEQARSGFKRATFLTQDRFSHNRASSQNRFFMAYGYPRSKNKKFFKEEIQPRALSLTGCSSEPHETPQELIETRKKHIFLRYSPESVENEQQEPHNPTAPAGMSGGALIDLGDFSRPENSAGSGGSPPLLAGILLEYQRTYQAMVAVNIRMITDAIENRERTEY